MRHCCQKQKHAFPRMKRTWLLRDIIIIIFKRCRAKVRGVILEENSSSGRQFCTSLTSNTNLSKVWKAIKSFSGNHSSYLIPSLFAQGISAKNNQHKSNILANQFALSISSINYPPRFVNTFLPTKTGLLLHALSHATPIDPRLHQAFSLKERLSSVQDTKNTTPGPDSICYEMFKTYVYIKIVRSHATVV